MIGLNSSEQGAPWEAGKHLYLFQAEENSTDGRPKGHRHSSRRSRRQHL